MNSFFVTLNIPAKSSNDENQHREIQVKQSGKPSCESVTKAIRTSDETKEDSCEAASKKQCH